MQRYIMVKDLSRNYVLYDTNHQNALAQVSDSYVNIMLAAIRLFEDCSDEEQRRLTNNAHASRL